MVLLVLVSEVCRIDFGISAAGVRLKCKAVAPEAPKLTVTRSGRFDSREELIACVKTTVRTAFGSMLMLGKRDACTGSLANIQRRAVSAIDLYRRPFRQHGQRSWGNVV